MNEIKRCPFCNSKSIKLKGRPVFSLEKQQLECQNCGAKGPRHDMDKKAIEAWNKRR